MIRFFKSAAFKIFAVVAAALLAGSVFAVTSRSGASPLTSVTSFIFGPISRASTRIASEFTDAKISFKSSTALANEVEALKKQVDALTAQLVGTLAMWSRNGKTIRVLQLFCVSPLWLIHNIFVFSIGGILCEVFNLGSIIVSLIRFIAPFISLRNSDFCNRNFIS
jgi:hypothetical protein